MSREAALSMPLASLMAHDGTYELTASVGELPRLSAVSGSSRDGAPIRVAVSVSAHILADGRTAWRLRGDVRFNWTGDCQRCLAPVEIAVTAPLDVVVAGDVDDTGEAWDAWEDDAELTLGSVVDEYALLALPLAPAHDGECGVAQAEHEPERTEALRQPFAELKELLRDRPVAATDGPTRKETDTDN
ncbi:MAG: YceD family protein [Pseudomonadota bacterium]